MKTLLFALLLALVPLSALADAPFMPEVAAKFANIETQTGSRTGWLRQARAVYDASLSGMGSATTHGLGVYLPAHSHLLRGWLEVSKHFDGAGGTIAFQCEDAGNILAATDFALTGTPAGVVTASYPSGTLIRAVPQDTLATVVRGTTIAAQCEISAVVATTAQSYGKVVVWLEYFVGE